MRNGTKTSDALKILEWHFLKSPRLKRLYEEEKVNFETALAIREAREDAGLTQAQLARKIGTTQSVISRLEDADYNGHSMKMLGRIAGALGRKVVIQLKPDKARR